MAYKPARQRVMVWPFKTVLPDGSVPPPTKIERINTFFESQIVQDGRLRKSTHGIGKDPSFLRQGLTPKLPMSHESTKGKINIKISPQFVEKEDETIKGGERYVSKARTRKRENKPVKPSLPSIINKPVRKPLLLASTRCTVVPKQQTRITPQIYHCAKDQLLHCQVDEVKKPVPKAKLYTGNSRKYLVNKSIETSSGDKRDKADGDGTFQLDISTHGSKPSPQECLRSFRQVRNGRKRYDVFWTPATSLTTETANGQLLITGKQTGRDSYSPGSSSSDIELPNSLISKSEKRSKMSSRDSPKGVNSSVKTSFKPATPQRELSYIRHLVSDGESDYNDQNLGVLDIMSSGSETGSTSGDPSLRLTGPQLRSSIQETINLNTEDINDDLKHAIEDYVAQIINQAQGICEKCVQDHRNT